MLITNLALFLYYDVIFMVPRAIIRSFFAVFFNIWRIICHRNMGFVSIDVEWSISYMSLIHYSVVSAPKK